MRRRQKSADKLMDMIIDITDMFWQVGAVVSAIFALLGIYSLKWAVAKNNPIDPTTIDAVVSTSIGWLFYGIPIMLFGLAMMMAWITFRSYTKQNRF